MSRNPTQKNLQGVQREKHALELRMSGMSYAMIASTMGVSKSTAFTTVERALRGIEEQTKHQVKIYRSLETVRLDALLRSVWEQAEAGSLQHVKVALKIMEQRSRLLGLYAPSQIKVETENISDEELVNKFRDAYARVIEAHSGGGEEGTEAPRGRDEGGPIVIHSKPSLNPPQSDS